ncbi:hypothetical protein C8Q76DRAFT_790416 [Earliella scabrosa]|nr:hypothetical protein C8Q76DRAFT_790416 [Earliella scabrosa]
MARTKQTARQSTGEAAPRASLQSRKSGPNLDSSDEEPLAAGGAGRRVKSSRQSSAKSDILGTPARRPVRNGQARKRKTKDAKEMGVSVVDLWDSSPRSSDRNDEFCYMCQNGGETLACDRCPRMVCYEHLPVVHTLPAETLAGVEFLCPACHIVDDRRGGRGLYHDVSGQRVPYFPNGITIEGDAFRPNQARVNTAPVVVVHIRLSSLNAAGTPAPVVHTTLEGYFVGKKAGDLVYVDAPYNITSVEESQEFKTALDRALAVVDRFERARILVFIYTHSEAGSGDLFYAHQVSSCDWWDDIIPAKLKSAGQQHDVTVALLCCGGLLNTPGKFDAFMGCCMRMKVRTLIAFGASAVQAVLASPFFVAYIHKVYIEGVILDQSHIADMLTSALYMARHTPVFIMTRAGRGGDQTTYTKAWFTPPLGVPASFAVPWMRFARFPALQANATGKHHNHLLECLVRESVYL